MDSFNSLSLCDTPKGQKLNRSMSLSELSPRKQVIVQQTLLSGLSGNSVLRQCSYEELSVIQGTSLRFSRKFVSELHVDLAGSTSVPEFVVPKSTISDKVNNFLSRTASPSETKTNSKETEQYRKRPHDPSEIYKDFKRKKRIRVTPVYSTPVSSEDAQSKSTSDFKLNRDMHSPRTVTHFLWVFVPVVLVMMATFGTQYAAYQKACDSRLDINSLEYLLSSNIFGQEKAVKNIVEAFKQFYSLENKNLQVIVFTGATGVGKTYAASLVEEIFPWKHNVHHFIMPIDFPSLLEHSFQKFPYCGDHLVIIDDLKEEDTKQIDYIVTYLQKIAERNKVTAVLIFKFFKQLAGKSSQAEVSEKIDKVQTSFIHKGVNCQVTDFKTLEKDDVIQCIRQALTRHWIPISDQAVNTVLDQVDYHSEGCKRISSKIAVLNELWVRHS